MGVEDAKFSGRLVVSYSNDSTQTFELFAKLAHPEICVVHSIDASSEMKTSNAGTFTYGVSHVDATRTVDLMLSNPSLADAHWEIVHAPKLYQASAFMQSMKADLGGDAAFRQPIVVRGRERRCWRLGRE